MVRRIVGKVWDNRKWLAALAGASLLPLAVRVLVMVENGHAVRIFDLFGAISDLGLGVVITVGLVALSRLGGAAFVTAASLWVAVNAAYYEFLSTHESPYLLIHAGFVLDGDFMLGSGIGLSHPYLTALALASILLLGRVAARGLRPRPRTLAGLSGTYGLLLLVLPLWDTGLHWRQRDFLATNVSDLAARVLWPDRIEEDMDAGSDLIAAYLRPDLSGSRFLSADAPFRNVVMVFIEGVAGGQLPFLAEAHGLGAELTMPQLDGLARNGLAYSTFVTHQKQSNRGLYAALCGDLPRLMAGPAKASLVAEGLGRDCLPRLLSRAGYGSLFLNAADNDFMLMGAFMRKIGFDRVLGSEDYDARLWRGNWGLDDASLYGVALAEIEALRRRERPYFVAVYTSSTHHPYGVPDDFPAGPDPRSRAWAFADRAVAGFVAELARRDQLDDTLVIITSDEATGTSESHRHKHGTLAGYTENWGFLIALAPERLRARVDAPFQQADIALSVLDYLGIEHDGAFIGRSLFRDYAAPRTIYSANVYKGLVHEYVEGETLTVCTEALVACEEFVTGGAPLFAFHHDRSEGRVTPSRLLRAVRRYSVLSPDPRLRPAAAGAP